MSKTVVTLKTKKPTAIEKHGKTGAVRSTQVGKGRPDLLSPLTEHRISMTMERGAEIYGDRNWEKGLPLGRGLASLLRHIRLWRVGDRTEDHLAQAYWNLHAMIHIEECILLGILPEELNDLPDYTRRTRSKARPARRGSTRQPKSRAARSVVRRR